MEVTPEQVAERMGFSLKNEPHYFVMLSSGNENSLPVAYYKACERIAELERAIAKVDHNWAVEILMARQAIRRSKEHERSNRTNIQ